MTRTIIATLVVPALLTFVTATQAEDWPQFRGPEGQGFATGAAPVEWSKKEGVKWRVALDDPGNGSPIVVGSNVLICSATKDGKTRSLICFNRQSGQRVWEQSVKFATEEETHKTNPHGATTPASDGERVVVSHGTAGLYCYDLSGREIWKIQPGVLKHMWGYATSPIIYKDRVFVNWGPGPSIFFAAYSLKDGSELFRTDEPQNGDGEKNSANKPMGSWCTPIVTDINGRTTVVCTFPTRVNGYDPDSGELLWHCEGISGRKGDLAYAQPHIDDSRCVAIGGYQGPGIGFDVGTASDLTDSRLWRLERNPQAIGSGVIVDGKLYMGFAGPNLIQCIDTETGKTLWRERSSAGAHWASAVIANGLIYATGQNGETIVFKPNPKKFEKVAANDLDETCNATPAIAHGQIFIRTYDALYCIE